MLIKLVMTTIVLISIINDCKSSPLQLQYPNHLQKHFNSVITAAAAAISTDASSSNTLQAFE
jgi:hypothetical protein